MIGHLERVAPEQLDVIQEYLQTVVPMVHGVERKQVGPMETLEFRQNMAGSKHPWRFLAQHRSDGTLRALGVLVALFQGNRDYAPTLVGIEEPETALHPAASAALRETLTRASGNAQMIDPVDAVDAEAAAEGRVRSRRKLPPKLCFATLVTAQPSRHRPRRAVDGGLDLWQASQPARG